MSLHRTLDGAKRTAEQAARPRLDGFMRSWVAHGQELQPVDVMGTKYRDLLFEVAPIDVQE
ncbi:MAG: hypothetical protein GEU82_06370 [Luteitalea sp.]|nr:hypothetical protein [Luteitalea sp.]